MRLANKNAIVTGAAKGMGSAITTTLAREGANVFLTARDVEALTPVARRVVDLGGKAFVHACDVTIEGEGDGGEGAGGVRPTDRHSCQCRRRDRADRNAVAEHRGGGFRPHDTCQSPRNVSVYQARSSDDDRASQREDREHRWHLGAARLSDADGLQRFQMGRARHNAHRRP
jgi:hypothetical protein